MDPDTGSRPWLVFFIDGQRYAIPVDCINELLYEDALLAGELPRANPAVGGVVRWRDQILPRVDLRQMLGLAPMSQQTRELIETMNQREADHVHWLKELEDAVREEREFTLATDPHLCAFGKWYDQVQRNETMRSAFTNHHPGLLRVLNAFDSPHQAIHQIAVQVDRLRHNGETEKAYEMIRITQATALSAMVKLFHDARRFIHRLHRTMVAIVNHDGRRLALIIDSIDLIVEQRNSEIKPFENTSEPVDLPLGVSHAPDGGHLLLHLTTQTLFNHCAAQAAA